MNDNIKELAEHAEEYATTRHPVSNIILSVNSDLFEQKFAELIVKDVFAEMGRQLFLHSELQASDPGYQKAMANSLKKLGVEQ